MSDASNTSGGSVIKIHGGRPLRGVVQVPADKSILHRALMFSALVKGTAVIEARHPGEDTLSTAAAMSALGVKIQYSCSSEGTFGEDSSGGRFILVSPGLEGLTEPAEIIDCGNSGTTIRLLTGLLTGAGVGCVLSGDASLQARPMGRICKPLRSFGAAVYGAESDAGEFAPITVSKGGFRGGDYTQAVASAQVKSALLLAGIAGGESVSIGEPALSRDHSERMLAAMGVALERTALAGGGYRVSYIPPSVLPVLNPPSLCVPGDISSAAFLLAAGVMVPGSKITVDNVGANPTRAGFISLLQQFGGVVTEVTKSAALGEPVGSFSASYGDVLCAPKAAVGGKVIPTLIDELVLLGAVAACSEGITTVIDAQELKVKESDRIAETVRVLTAFGAHAEACDDGFVVYGGKPLHGANLDVSSDHRIALTAAILALAIEGESILRGFEIAEVSFKGFVPMLQSLGATISWC